MLVARSPCATIARLDRDILFRTRRAIRGAAESRPVSAGPRPASAQSQACRTESRARDLTSGDRSHPRRRQARRTDSCTSTGSRLPGDLHDATHRPEARTSSAAIVADITTTARSSRDSIACFARRQRHVGVDAPLVKFVEDDHRSRSAADRFAARGEDPFRGHEEPRAIGEFPLEADLPAHFVADRPAALRRDPPRQPVRPRAAAAARGPCRPPPARGEPWSSSLRPAPPRSRPRATSGDARGSPEGRDRSGVTACRCKISLSTPSPDQNGPPAVQGRGWPGWRRRSGSLRRRGR